jgi:putative tricarboxylic transport membrane protein
MANRIIVGFAVILAGLYLYATEQIPVVLLDDPLGPKAFPRLLGAALLGIAIMLLWESFDKKKVRAAIPAEGSERPAGWRHYRVVGALTIWTSLYVALFEWAGYALSTSIYLLVLTACFNRGRWLSNVLTAVLFSFVSYGVFTRLLAVSLPRGILPF